MRRREFLTGAAALASYAAIERAHALTPSQRLVVLGKAGISYDPAALALFARMTTQPSAAVKAVYNSAIINLKGFGLWSTRDAIYSLNAVDAQAASLNWVANQYNLTAVNSPTFTPYQGYAGNGTSSYLDTGFTPSTATAPNYTLNNASISIKSNTNARIDASAMMGTGSTLSLNPWNASNGTGTNGINGVLVFGGTPTTTLDLFTLSRLTSAAYTEYQNSTDIDDRGSASTSVPSSSIRLLSDGTYFSTRQAQWAQIGSGLSATQVANLNSVEIAFSTAMNAIGNFYG